MPDEPLGAQPTRPDWGPTSTVPWVLASTHLLDKYSPPERLTVEALEDLRTKVLSNTMPTNLGHDYGKPFPMWFVDADIRETDDGEHQLVATVEIPTASLATFLADAAAAGGPGGFSYSRSKRLSVTDLPGEPERPPGGYPVRLAVDALVSRDAIAEAAVVLANGLGEPNEVDLIYAYSREDLIGIVLTIGQNVSLNLLSAVAWEAVKHVFKGGPDQVSSITVERLHPDGEVLRAVVTTSDEKLAETALGLLGELNDHKPPLAVFDHDAGAWDWPDRS